MNRIAKGLALLLAAVLLLPACSQVPGTNPDADTDPIVTEDTSTPETESPYPPLEMIEYDGETFTFLVGGCKEWSFKNDIHTEDFNGTPVNDAMHERNIYIETTYNIEIADREEFGTSFNGQGASFQFLQQAHQAGDTTINVAIVGPYEGNTLAVNSLSQDFYALPQLYLEGPWWDQGIIRDCSIAGQLYILDGAITTVSSDATIGVVFNKDMAGDLNLGNFYELVETANGLLIKWENSPRRPSRT